MNTFQNVKLDAVNTFLIGLLSAAISTNSPAAVSNLVAAKTGIRVNLSAAANDPLDKELHAIMLEDERAQNEADKWIRDARAFEKAGAGIGNATLAARVEERLKPVRQLYEDFISRHPTHAGARLAYGSFLSDIQDDGCLVQWTKARELEPDNPAPLNNLANYYGHYGPASKAFDLYEKAIQLNTNEPVYLQNLATTTYLFRKDAKEHYKIDEQQVFDKALDLYKRALKLDPTNFLYATDLAQSYYGIKPLRANDAIAAWNYALNVATTDVEKQGTYLHLARIELNSGHYGDAHKHLAAVTNAEMSELKERLTRNLEAKEKGDKPSAASGTDNPPVKSVK